jgi:thiomorpholine-carboxylate dehydrogenase
MMHLDEADVRAVLSWDRLIAATEAALAAFSPGRVIQPMRTVLTIEEGHRYLGVMPAAADDAMGLKVVSFYPGNRGTIHPTHLAMILLLDPATGQPLVLMDGRLITAMRTAAVSAPVTKRRGSPDSRVLALLGIGVLAKAHLAALAQVRRFDEVRVWSRTPEHARRFASEHGARAVDAEGGGAGGGLVVTTTNALEPILRGAWLKPGAHVNAVGSPRPMWRELDDEAMRSVLVVDSREAVLEESGELILSGASTYAVVGEIFAGSTPSPALGKTTVFKSVGVAAEDLAAARLVYDAVRSRDDERE